MGSWKDPCKMKKPAACYLSECRVRFVRPVPKVSGRHFAACLLRLCLPGKDVGTALLYKYDKKENASCNSFTVVIK